MFKVDNGGNHRAVDDHVADYLAGSRTTKDGSPFEVVAQLPHEVTRLYQRSSTENEHDTVSSDFASWQIRLPPVALAPFVLCRFHQLSPSPKTDTGP
jgi:hypothetical protein